MNCSSSLIQQRNIAILALICCAPIGCKPRAFNDAATASSALVHDLEAEALTSSLLPLWPLPRSLDEVKSLPAAQDLKLPQEFFASLIQELFTHPDSGQPLTLASPQCARTPDAWRVSSARLSLYEIDLPGNVSNWQTLALQRETDLAQRVQLHVTMQPWCSSQRINNAQFIHTLDQSLLLSFDLTAHQLPERHRVWLDSFASSAKGTSARTVASESEILPYARSLIEINESSRGRKPIVELWTSSLQTAQLLSEKKLPSDAWTQLKQSLGGEHTLRSAATRPYAHPALQANPRALAPFFAAHISLKNLIRVRAHITEGLGTAQYFMLWEKTKGALQRKHLQTTGAAWDRSADTLTLAPLLNQPPQRVSVGQRLRVRPEQQLLVADVDLESTVLAEDITAKELIALSSKTIDFEKTSVHSTRCVSCHAIDDAYRFASAGRPVSQRGLEPAQLTLSGFNIDSQPVLNWRSLRQAESDAKRFLKERSQTQPAAR